MVIRTVWYKIDILGNNHNKIDNLDLTKMNNICVLEDIIKKMEKPTEWEKIFSIQNM